MRTRVPFEGTPPQVQRGDTVECRTASGEWVTSVAEGPARYDDANAIGSLVFLTVPIRYTDGSVVNWPASAVRHQPAEDESDEWSCCPDHANLRKAP